MPTITVGELRQFVSDSANSMADVLAGRILSRVIQGAMRRLSREGDWTFKRKRELLWFEPSQQCENALLVNGSPRVTIDPLVAGSFPIEPRFYTESWNVQLGGRETVYRWAEPPSGDTFLLTSPWPGDTTPIAVPQTYVNMIVSRSLYPLPGPANQVYAVELPMQGVNALTYISPSNFETYRRGLLTSRSQPWVYTLRDNDKLEIWPPPGTDTGLEAEVDYQELVKIPALDALDEEILDWPAAMEDLLWAAARYQLVVELGADAVQFDANAAVGEYQRMLSIFKAEDQSRGKSVWNMGGVTAKGFPRPMGLDLRAQVQGEG